MPGFCTASYRLDDLLRSSTSNEGSCRVQRILEGIFIFQLTKKDSRFTLETSSTCHNFSNSIGCNSYAYLLHDSVWALISSVDTDSNEAPTIGNSAERNPYSHLLHDSVWALISSLATGSFSNSNEALLPFHSKSDNSMVYVYHNLNSTAGLKLVGIYNGTSHAFTNMSEITFTDHDLPVVNKEACSLFTSIANPVYGIQHHTACSLYSFPQ